jgi:uncharacterized coiled-coil protein SlyX
LTSQKEQFYIRRIAELEEQLKQRDERIAALEKQVAELIKINTELTDKVVKLSENSSNSSKSPSSDIAKPTRKKKGNGSRNTGGQPGHARHKRPPEVNDFQTHTLDVCPDCGGKLKEVESASAPMPANIEKNQLIGQQLTATIAYMKGTCHCSFSTIRKFLRDVVGITDKATAEYGQKLLDAMHDMFSVFHKAEELTASDFAKAMEVSRKAFLGIALSNVSDSRQAQNLANRFREQGDAYF